MVFIKKELTRLKLRRRGRFSQSSFVSLILRPVLEKNRVSSVMGAPLFAAMMMGANFFPTTQDQLTSAVAAQLNPDQVLEVKLQSIETVHSDPYYKFPVIEYLGVSQYFQLGHPALDIRAVMGSPVVAMDRGVVDQVIYDRFGYGRHVIIRHAEGVETVYAHMELILVQTGQVIEAGEIVGTIGMTGWSTGPHLHFEVRENGYQVNPLPYVKPALQELIGR